MRIEAGDLSDPRIVTLIRHHFETARANTGRGSAHVLDLSGLSSPDIRLWSLWEQDTLIGVGALKVIEPGHGEVKSMHVAEAARGRGAGRFILGHIITAARAAGLTRLSLETGSWPYFKPAVVLYRRAGFIACPPFAGYKPDPNSIFMTRDLTAL